MLFNYDWNQDLSQIEIMLQDKDNYYSLVWRESEGVNKLLERIKQGVDHIAK